MSSFSFLFLLVMVLLSVAFFTLIELRVLGISHIRLGPDRVGFFGYFQALADLIKLFEKAVSYFTFFYSFFFFFSPLWGIFLGLLVWLVFFGSFSFSSFFYGVLLFFCLTRLFVYFVLLGGWSSGRVYSRLGSYRSRVQLISYEVSMFFVFICLMLYLNSFDFFFYSDVWFGVFIFLFFSPLFFCWVVCCLAERNRTPFDFSEGESELVSGFNTEYYGGYFSFFIVSEYSSMLFFSFVSRLLFFGSGYFYLFFFFFVFLFIWVRACFPRLRFDRLMYFNWKSVLPLVLSYFLFFSGFLIFSEDSLFRILALGA